MLNGSILAQGIWLVDWVPSCWPTRCWNWKPMKSIEKLPGPSFFPAGVVFQALASCRCGSWISSSCAEKQHPDGKHHDFFTLISKSFWAFRSPNSESEKKHPVIRTLSLPPSYKSDGASTSGWPTAPRCSMDGRTWQHRMWETHCTDVADGKAWLWMRRCCKEGGFLADNDTERISHSIFWLMLKRYGQCHGTSSRLSNSFGGGSRYEGFQVSWQVPAAPTIRSLDIISPYQFSIPTGKLTRSWRNGRIQDSRSRKKRDQLGQETAVLRCSEESCTRNQLEKSRVIFTGNPQKGQIWRLTTRWILYIYEIYRYIKILFPRQLHLEFPRRCILPRNRPQPLCKVALSCFAAAPSGPPEILMEQGECSWATVFKSIFGHMYRDDVGNLFFWPLTLFFWPLPCFFDTWPCFFEPYYTFRI